MVVSSHEIPHESKSSFKGSDKSKCSKPLNYNDTILWYLNSCIEFSLSKTTWSKSSYHSCHCSLPGFCLARPQVPRLSLQPFIFSVPSEMKPHHQALSLWTSPSVDSSPFLAEPYSCGACQTMFLFCKKVSITCKSKWLFTNIKCSCIQNWFVT